jgi:S-adenosylmethionine hydrolase
VSASPNRSVVFVSDFGYRNEWVGICHAVIESAAPSTRVIDLSHGVPPLDVRDGALLLADSLPFLHDDAVLLAVVDPNVGRDRDLALETMRGRLLVGPDNGLLSLVWTADGGVKRAHEVTSDAVVRNPVAPSFHARDVLAPAAAFLAAGRPLEELGPPVDPGVLATIALPTITVENGKIECEVLDLNRFGNVLLNVRPEDFAAAGLDEVDTIAVDATSGSATARRVSTYADLLPNDWGIIVDPRGWLSIVRGNPGNASAGLGNVASGDPIWLGIPR